MSELEKRIEQLERRLDREKRARQEAERLLEEKSMDLYHANQELLSFATAMEKLAGSEQEKNQEQSRLNAELRSALDAHALISITDVKGSIIYANDTFCQVSGYSLEELLGKNHRIVNSGYHDKDYIRRMWETISNGRIWQGIFCNRNKDGSLYWVESTIKPLLDESGKIYQYISIRQDVTATKTANEELIMLKRAVDACSEMIIIYNAQFNVQYANPSLYKSTGLAEYALIDREVGVLYSVNVNRESLYEMQCMLENDEGWAGRLLVKRILPLSNNGQETESEFWAELSITPVLNRDGTVAGYVQIQHDITELIAIESVQQMEKKDTEARLAIAEVLQQATPLRDRFTRILAILFELKDLDSLRSGGIFLCDDSNTSFDVFVRGGVFSENLQTEENHIFSDNFVCGRIEIPNELLISNECASSSSNEQRANSIVHGHYVVPIRVAGSVMGILFLYTNPNPTRHHTRLTMLKQVGEFLALAILQERAKVSLENARDVAMKTALIKSEFLSNMSHEIRTPMNGVLGMLDLLRDTNMSSNQSDLLNTAHTAAENLLEIINDILDFSKLEVGKMEVESIRFNLVKLLDDVCALLASRAYAKGLELSCFVSVDVPKYWQGDSNRIRQVLLNLIGNAIKFTEQGEVSVTVTKAFTAEEKPLLRFEVRDTGIGISYEAQQNLFQPFSQAESNTARRFGGTGLGLSISKDLVALMAGTIGLESEPNKGTCFWFELPLTLSDELEISPPVLSGIEGKRVLVVDGNVTNRTILKCYLTHWGFSVVQAGNDSEALVELEKSVAHREPYDLVLLDTDRFKTDGLTLPKMIENSSLKTIPFILLSHSPVTGTNIQGFHTQNLLKPIRQSQLFDAIANILDPCAVPITSDKSTGAVSATNYTGKKLLVAEDNKVNQKVILGMLAKFQLFPDVADNGQLALELLTKNTYDLIFMDCQMPVLDGYQTTQELRRFEIESELPRQTIVALTAHAIKGEREKCLEVGMDDYLTKPISQTKLADILETWLTSKPIENTSPALESVSPVTDCLSLWDKKTALAYIEDDEELLKIMMGEFLAETPKLLSDLQKAVDEHDFVALNGLAHAVKGSLSYFAADKIMDYASQLEYAAKSEPQNEKYQALTEVLIDKTTALMKDFQKFTVENPL